MFILSVLLILYGVDSRELLAIIGGIVRSKRKKQKISQERLAELADLHPTYISEIERGRLENQADREEKAEAGLAGGKRDAVGNR